MLDIMAGTHSSQLLLEPIHDEYRAQTWRTQAERSILFRLEHGIRLFHRYVSTTIQLPKYFSAGLNNLELDSYHLSTYCVYCYGSKPSAACSVN